MIRLIKLHYWKWVVSSCRDEMEELRFWIPKLNRESRRLAIKEQVSVIQSLIKAQRRVIQLSN